MALDIVTLTGGHPRVYFPLSQKDKVAAVAREGFGTAAEAQAFIESADMSRFHVPLTYKRFREASVVLTGLMIVAAIVAMVFAPKVALIAAILLLLAIGCEVASRDQRKQLDQSLKGQIAQYLGQRECLRHKQLEGRIERLAYVEEYLERPGSKRVEGQYTRDALISSVAHQNHFSACAEDYRYRLREIEAKEEAYTQTLYESYVRRFLHSHRERPQETAYERFKDCIEGNQGEFLQKRALQLSAFLKLLGDHNAALPREINEHLSERELRMDLVPSQVGQMDVMFSDEGLGEQKIFFQVRGERYSAYAKDNKEVGFFQTSRQFEISAPDQNGNIKYSISRSYICSG